MTKKLNKGLELSVISRNEKATIDLDAPGFLKSLSERILQDIDEYCKNTYDGGHRTHLGASLIGHSCSRYCWFTFRHVYHARHNGRMLRLFNRGHREEERFIEWLRGVGFQVWDIQKCLFYHAESDSYLIENSNFQLNNLNIDAQLCVDVSDNDDHVKKANSQGVFFKKEQYTIKGVFGHFGGSLDSGAIFPEHYNINLPLLCEFKTSGTGRKFEDLKNKGVKIAKPQHYAQMCVYGYKYRLQYALYLCINKNDDDLHVEVLKLDWNFGAELELKALDVIQSQTPPPRLAENSTYYECKYCDYLNICHNGGQIEKNCRSCVNAVPVENAQWNCSTWNSIIPKEFIPKGCDKWKAIL